MTSPPASVARPFVPRLLVEIVPTDTIEIDEHRLGGAPCLEGRRFSIAQVIAEIADEGSIQAFADSFEFDPEPIKRALHDVSSAIRQAHERDWNERRQHANAASPPPATGSDWNAGVRAAAKACADYALSLNYYDPLEKRHRIAADALSDRVLSLLRPATGTAPNAEAWMPTHRHRKGGLYRVIARATNCSGPELIDVVVYDEEGGKTTWVREAAQFDDGRFEPLPVEAASALDAARAGEET